MRNQVVTIIFCLFIVSIVSSSIVLSATPPENPSSKQNDAKNVDKVANTKVKKEAIATGWEVTVAQEGAETATVIESNVEELDISINGEAVAGECGPNSGTCIDFSEIIKAVIKEGETKVSLGESGIGSNWDVVVFGTSEGAHYEITAPGVELTYSDKGVTYSGNLDSIVENLRITSGLETPQSIGSQLAEGLNSFTSLPDTVSDTLRSFSILKITPEAQIDLGAPGPFTFNAKYSVPGSEGNTDVAFSISKTVNLPNYVGYVQDFGNIPQQVAIGYARDLIHGKTGAIGEYIPPLAPPKYDSEAFRESLTDGVFTWGIVMQCPTIFSCNPIPK